MVRDELTDGKRIGQLLSSEIHGRERGALGRLAVVEADREVEPTAEGQFAYGIAIEEPAAGRVAAAYVHSERLRLEFEAGVETATAAAKRFGLSVSPEETDPPRAGVFVESGAEVKGALGVLRDVTEERLEAID